ncbi:heparan-alpha-glucosaminide N-acetyltransferase domain-containing protein [Flavihumibacter sp. CACIAM 22H1]|uniref:DUF1624 domain-containing protein n=1 Tax=Flavihumibacter sp. CACIAM 22H1 TaxID=1812911 RepID=UPI0007A7C3B8|nr:heparan-alpha-glucosaminide N-acetyltransferase domain-containing protein [Flavihumibacter sp. CACIAM 22H1]KYP13346.1 MAG: hypothetical protein A1D16_19480 [Flavihumibacter sp. CACIAM 22H1]
MVLNKRISAIDQLRGLVMIIMALDHTRDLFHETALTEDPLNLATTTPALFFTRWVTHLCAPSFVFLAGVSIYLQQQKQADPAILRNRLLLRGAWLVLLEFTLVNFGIWFNIHFNVLLFQVIGAIGVGFMATALLIRIPSKFLLLSGLSILLLQGFYPIQVLTAQAFLPLGPTHNLLIAYPILSWLAILLIGVGAGPAFSQPARKASWYGWMGLGLIVLGSIVRGFNSYGDPGKWKTESSSLYSFMSFINLQKYPPSLLFSMILLGIAFLLFAFLKTRRLPAPISNILEVYGSVPLFYYVLHWYLIHSIMVLAFLAKGYSISQLNFGAFGFGRPSTLPNGFSLGTVYLVWITAVLILYPACVRYRRFKLENRQSFMARYL